jgi:hypothetical protein
MGINLSKTSHVFFFIVFLPAVSFGVGWLFSLAFPNLPFWVEGLSPLAAFGLLYSWFEKYMWHWPIFRGLGVVAVPDVRGRWLGEQVSSFKNEDGSHRKSRVIMEVQQTFSSINIETFYKNWQTEHTISSFVDVDGTPVLFVMFETAPKVGYDGDATAHKGVIRLSSVPNARLVGTYFNANGASGELSFKRTHYTLHRTFESVS